MYSVGNRLKISLFGKSHGRCVGCIVEGFPKGMKIDTEFLERRMDLRKPSDIIGTKRKEDDSVFFEYGVSDGIVISDKIMITIPNGNTDSSSYSEYNTCPRPGHADLPALMKIKDHDVAGGAQFSGRMTAPLVAAGALAQQYLSSKGIEVAGYTKQIYDVMDGKEHSFAEIKESEKFRTRAVDKELDDAMTKCIINASEEGDSVGGIVSCSVIGLPIGFGGIWFDALDTSIARMMFSIPGVKGVEFGKGFDIASMKGSQSNDQYAIKKKEIIALSNNMGGVCGGMSDGMPLNFDVAFKPTPSISKEQFTVDLEKRRNTKISIKGRHDPCIVPRAVSVVEAMTSITILDQYLSF